MKPFIDPAFWSDPDIEEQTPGVKLCALWLFTNSQTSLLGLCSASTGRFTFETKLPATALDKTVEALPRAFLKFENTIFVRNYIRHQFGSGEKLVRNNFFVALKSLLLSVKNEKLRDAIALDYPEFLEALGKPSKGLIKPKDRKGKGSTGKEGQDFEFPEKSSEKFKTRFEQWTVVRRGMGKKPGDWNAMFNEQLRWLESFPDPVRIEIVSQSIRNNWQGLFEVKHGANGAEPRKKIDVNEPAGGYRDVTDYSKTK